MTTRHITWTVDYTSSGNLVFQLKMAIISAGITVPAQTFTVAFVDAVSGSTDLPVPDSGTATYDVTLPSSEKYQFYLASGVAVDLATIIAVSGSPTADTAAAVSAHAAVIASSSVLGHIKVGTALGIAGDGTLSAIPSTIPIRAAYSTQTWTAMPAALTEFNGGQQGRIKADLTNATQARLIVRTQSTVGASGAELRVQYSTDESTWNYLDSATGPSVPLNAANATQVSSWVTLVAGAKADVFLRVVGINGDGIISPTVGNINVQVR